jgi:hypothetical protein
MAYKLSRETLEHIAAMNWLKLQYPAIFDCTFHIANERKCSPAYGKILKKMGVKKGVSDLFIGHPNSSYAGLFIEIKAPGGKLSAEQESFLNLMNAKGYYACCSFGADEVIRTIKWYLKLD